MTTPACLIAPLLGGRAPLLRSYVGAQFDGANNTIYTYNSQAIGSGQWLIVGVSYNSGSGIAVNGVTVNGNAMTKIGSDGASGESFWRIAHPGGSTADIVVTCASDCTRGVMAVWTMNGTPDSWTPKDTFNKGTDTTIDLYAGGVAFGIGTDADSSTDTWTAGLTADATAQLGGDSNSGIVASSQPATTQLGATCTTSASVNAFAISLY